MYSDDQIIQALKDADSKGKLGVVAAVVGFDENELKEVMNGNKVMTIIHKDMLGMHLNLEENFDKQFK